MALAKGTNCGFITISPTDDPAASGQSVVDTYAWGFKDTTPQGLFIVTEMGWYCNGATQAANFDVGIYSHDAGNNRPNALLTSVINQAKGTGAGWKKVTGLSFVLLGNTIYWLGVQLDDTATATYFDAEVVGGEKMDYKSSQTSLPSTWGVSSNTVANTGAIYALIKKIGCGSGIGSPMIF